MSLHKRRLFLAGLFASLFCLAPLGAQGFRIFSVGDPVLEDLRYLSREAGASLLSLTPPLSGDEIRNALESVDPDRLSDEGRRAYGRVSAALKPSPALKDGVFGLSAAPRATFSGRARSDADLDWSTAEKDVPALLSLPLEIYLADRVYAAADLDIRTDPSYYDESGTKLSSNAPSQASRLDLNLPLRSFMGTGGSWWNFRIGRDKASFGVARTGNLAINDSPSYYDFARLSLFSRNFKYSLFVAQLPMDASPYASESLLDISDSAYVAHTTQRYLYYHRWDFRLWNRLSVGIGEGALVGNSPLELRFLNPLGLYHNYFSWLDYDYMSTTDGKSGESNTEGSFVGSLLSLDLDWAVAPGLSAYGQVVMNDYSTAYEKSNWPESTNPNGLGYLGGLEYAKAYDTVRGVYGLEAVYADPFLYTLSSPYCSYVAMRRLSALSTKDPLYSWIGTPEGRDFFLVSLRADFSRGAVSERGSSGVEFKASYKFAGERDHLEWDWGRGEKSTEVAPTGTPERRFTLKASPRWSPLQGVSLGVSLAYLRIDDADHVKGKVEQGAESTFTVAWRY